MPLLELVTEPEMQTYEMLENNVMCILFSIRGRYWPGQPRAGGSENNTKLLSGLSKRFYFALLSFFVKIL